MGSEPMGRRALLGCSIAVLGAPVLAAGWPRRGRAQRRRADWSASGPLDGREPTDLAALTPEERLHVPVLVLPERVRAGRPFDLVVQVGLEPHPMTEAHYIDWVEVAIGERRSFIADLTHEVAYPVVRVPLVLGAPAPLTVRAHCSLHGTWRTRRALAVG